MSKIYDEILTVEDLYAKTKVEYDYWHDRIIYKDTYITDNAILAAQYYGQLRALAIVNYRLLGDKGLMNLFKDIHPKVYKTDYEDEES